MRLQPGAEGAGRPMPRGIRKKWMDALKGHESPDSNLHQQLPDSPSRSLAARQAAIHRRCKPGASLHSAPGFALPAFQAADPMTTARCARIAGVISNDFIGSVMI